jgi:hypothetical protein
METKGDVSLNGFHHVNENGEIEHNTHQVHGTGNRYVNCFLSFRKKDSDYLRVTNVVMVRPSLRQYRPKYLRYTGRVITNVLTLTRVQRF